MIKIGIVNYGMGNIGSVRNALRLLGIDSVLVNEPSDLEEAEGILLPGVGSFGKAMENLHNSDLVPAMTEAVMDRGKPFLGICLGMQLILEGSEESEGVEGLGWIKGKATIIAPDRMDDPSIKRPHVGWNEARPIDSSDTMFTRLNEGDIFYFDHSYAVPADITGTNSLCDYHGDFAASLRVGNILAAQFHPEKSQRAGLILLRNFSNMIADPMAFTAASSNPHEQGASLA